MTNDELIARIAKAFSTRLVREALDDLSLSNWEIFGDGRFSRTRPCPTTLYPDDDNLYYAWGWGMHQWLWPWERWLLRRCITAALRAKGDG